MTQYLIHFIKRKLWFLNGWLWRWHKLNTHPAFGQHLDDMAKIAQLAGKLVHAMHDHRIAGAHEGQQRVELRSLRVLSRCLLDRFGR